MAPLRSVLIVRLSAIGDVIHALPVLDALRRLLPEAKIGWLVEELSAPLLENHPQLDRLHVIPKKRWRKDKKVLLREARPFFAAIREEGYEAAVDLQGLTKSGLAAWASGPRLRVGYAGKDGREINKLFTNRRITPPPEARHVVQRNLSLLRGLELEPPLDARGRIGLREEERERMREMLRGLGWRDREPLLALNPGAGWASKRWPPERFGEVGARLAREVPGRDPALIERLFPIEVAPDAPFRPLVLWGPGEEALRDAVAERLRAEGVPFLVAPPTRIRELAVLISLCAAFIGGDTGPTHLAGLLGLHTTSIFGASDGFRNRPWPVAAGPLVQRLELPCVPCWKTMCPLPGDAHMACLAIRELGPHMQG